MCVCVRTCECVLWLRVQTCFTPASLLINETNCHGTNTTQGPKQPHSNVPPPPPPRVMLYCQSGVADTTKMADLTNFRHQGGKEGGGGEDETNLCKGSGC